MRARKGMRRRVAWLMALAVLGAAASTAGWLCHAHGREGLPFSRALWLRPPRSEVSVRYRMVGDLMRQHLRLGMHQSLVERILGKPNEVLRRSEGTVHRYILGYVGGLSPTPPLDPTVLELVYDRGGRLSAMRVYET